MDIKENRYIFAMRWALRHAVVSAAIALLSALLVFKLWYPMPYREMLGVGSIFLLILVVDVVCGPLMTLVLANPGKSRREMKLDFSLVAIIQIAALVYGLHSVWVGRPVILAFETDRFLVVSANEIEADDLKLAPKNLQTLPLYGVQEVATRRAKNNQEFLQSIDLSLAGSPPSLRPAWWEPISDQEAQIRERIKPVSELIERRQESASLLQNAIKESGYMEQDLTYLPLTSSKTKDWVALLNASLKIVGYANVDGF